MRNILMLARHELKRHWKAKGFLLGTLFFIFLVDGINILIVRGILAQPPEELKQVVTPAQEEFEQVLIPMLLTYLSTLPFMFIAFGGTSLINPTIYREKVSKRLLFLLSSPLRVYEIWLGKTLALYLLGLMAGIIGTVIYYFGIRVFLDLEISLSWDIVGWVFYNITVMPLAVLSLGTLFSLLIRRSDMAASFLTTIIVLLFVAQGFIPFKVQQNLAYLQKLNYLTGIVIGAIVVILAALLLNKERVVRTCL